MLPVEIFTEAVAFLSLYDLDAVLFTNRQLSIVASKCVKGIRVWRFDHASVVLSGDSMSMNANDDVCSAVKGREKTTKVLGIALHNSRFTALSFILSPDDVPLLPNKSALEVKKLILTVYGVPSADFLVDVIARFRKVEAVSLFGCANIADFSPVIDLCRQKGIRKVTTDAVDLMPEH